MKKMVLFLSSLSVSIGCFSMEKQVGDYAKAMTAVSVALFRAICAAKPLHQPTSGHMRILFEQVQATHSYFEGTNDRATALEKDTKDFNDALVQLFGKDNSPSARYVAINHIIDLALEDQEDAKDVVLSAYNSRDLDEVIKIYTKTDMIYVIAERITQQDINDLEWRRNFYIQAWIDINNSSQAKHDFLWFLVDDVKKWCQEKRDILSLLAVLQEGFKCPITALKVEDGYEIVLSELLLTIASEILKDQPSDKQGKVLLKKSMELGNGIALDYVRHEYSDLIQ